MLSAIPGGTARATGPYVSQGSETFVAVSSPPEIETVDSNTGAVVGSSIPLSETPTGLDEWYSNGDASSQLIVSETTGGSTTGLVYLVHRYYDPATGQFMSVDPEVAETDQAYEYARNNPVGFPDLAVVEEAIETDWPMTGLGVPTCSIRVDSPHLGTKPSGDVSVHGTFWCKNRRRVKHVAVTVTLWKQGSGGKYLLATGANAGSNRYSISANARARCISDERSTYQGKGGALYLPYGWSGSPLILSNLWGPLNTVDCGTAGS